jgi:hypothetical protein
MGQTAGLADMISFAQLVLYLAFFGAFGIAGVFFAVLDEKNENPISLLYRLAGSFCFGIFFLGPFLGRALVD